MPLDAFEHGLLLYVMTPEEKVTSNGGPSEWAEVDSWTHDLERQRQEYDKDEPARFGMTQEQGFYQTVAKELRDIPAATFRTEVVKIIKHHEQVNAGLKTADRQWDYIWSCHLPDPIDHEFSSMQLLEAMVLTSRKVTPGLPCSSRGRKDSAKMVLHILIVVVISAANFILQPGSFDQKVTCLSCNLWNFIFLPIVMWCTSYVLQYPARYFEQLSVDILYKERLTEAIGDDRTLAELCNSLANELDNMAPETVKWVLRELPFASFAHRTHGYPKIWGLTRAHARAVDIDEATAKMFETNSYFQAFYRVLSMESSQTYENNNFSGSYQSCAIVTLAIQSVLGVALAYLLASGPLKCSPFVTSYTD